MKKITSHGLEIIATDGLPNRNMTLHLYTNDVTPANDGMFTSTTFTEASTEDGYAEATLESTAWAFSTADSGGYPTYEATQAQVDFVFDSTSEINVYGWYTLSTDDNVVWAERLSPTANLPSGSGTISINPKHVFSVQAE